MTALAIICLPFSMLGFTALATVLPNAVASIANQGPHGFSEILYAFTSATANNGSAFGGLTGNTVFYNITLGLAMIIGRFAIIVPMLAVAGSLARKRKIATSVGTFPTDGALWVCILVAVILVVGGLTFFPALSLGPIVEHFSMLSGTLY
jgi:K+-transporting ATPase ATPase A chain